MRTKEQWIDELKSTMPKCKWFIEKYFGEEKYNAILILAESGETLKIYKILNDIWFKLPDSFNILNGMSEWLDFLNLVEFYSEEESSEIFK